MEQKEGEEDGKQHQEKNTDKGKRNSQTFGEKVVEGGLGPAAVGDLLDEWGSVHPPDRPD